MTGGWEQLSLRDNQLVISGEEETAVPIYQIRDLVITASTASISVPLINALVENGVNVIVCNARFEPMGTIVGLNGHCEAAGRLMDQVSFTDESKDEIWKLIVNAKIRNQIALLRKVGKEPDPKYDEYLEGLKPGDPDNREGQAARLYFSQLFGNDFLRHAPDEINAALNYGYAIIRSMISRILAVHGYNCALGIHHRGRANSFNLSCDLMEPFRPMVDLIVYSYGGAELDTEYKKKLIGILQERCRYKGRSEKLQQAMERYVIDVMKKLEESSHEIGEIEFS